MKLNPFRPNSIAGPGVFAGRYNEMKSIDQALFQLRHGNPWHFLIHGERGIGKSSLIFCADRVARGILPPMEDDDEKFSFIPVSISLDPTTSFRGIAEKIGCELARELSARDGLKASLKSIWEFVSRWDMFGLKFNAERREIRDSDLVEELSETFIRLSVALAGKADGFLVLIDEADKAGGSELGEFIKLFTERLTKRGCGNVGLGLSGISTVTDQLK